MFDCQGDTPVPGDRRTTGHTGPDEPAQRSRGGTSYASQMASHTFRTGTPASMASTALRPPRSEKR